jgi:hypothetical protein
MGRTRLLIVSAIALLTAGIFAGIGLVFLNPFSKAAPRAEAIRSVRSDGLIQENFIFRTATDSIAATHSGDLPLPPLPQSIALLSATSAMKSSASPWNRSRYSRAAIS